jgi:hypothetical protein
MATLDTVRSIITASKRSLGVAETDAKRGRPDEVHRQIAHVRGQLDMAQDLLKDLEGPHMSYSQFLKEVA